MCGRFSLSGDIDLYADYFGIDLALTEALAPSWNVAPTDPVYVVRNEGAERQMTAMSWGLRPHWADDGAGIHINARAETVAHTPAFRDSFARKRCIIPADGFYEWEPEEQGRSPHWVFRSDGAPMAFAGIWATRRDQASGDWSRTCSIITTASEGHLTRIHDRMPVSLQPDIWDAWLDRDLRDTDEAEALIQPVSHDEMSEHSVSTLVNSVRNNGPQLLDRVEQGRLL